MFRIYKKNKNFVMWVSFVLISLVIISVLNFNNLPYANENERSGLSDQSNIEFTDTEEKDPKASQDIDLGGTYTGITYTDNVWIKTSDAVIFKSCTFQANLYMADASNYWDFDVTVDLCTLNKIHIAYDFGDTLSVKNSTLTRISDDSSADDTTNIEVINCSFVGSEYYQLYIYRSSVDLKNCTLTNNAYFLYGGNTVVIEDSEFDSALGFGSDTTDVTIRNCKTTDISLPNGPITIQDTVSQNFDVEFDCSINETLELISDTPNVVLSNFFLGDPLPGEFSQIVITEANLNVSDITKEINSKLYILQWQDSELYVKNSYLAYMINGDGISGNCKVSYLQNCTLMNTWIRSNNTVISNCSIYNILDVDTNPYPFGGSNKPFKIENSNFLDVMIHVISGGVDIDNCDFKTDMGLLWLDAYEHPYDEKKDSFALINNSNPKIINLGLNTSIIAENLVDCNSISMRDTSHGTFNNVDVGTMNVLDSATATIDNCHINSVTFDSPNVQITNSIVDSMAPRPVALISPLIDPNDFLLDWSAQPGQSLTGNIDSYRIYRASTNIGGEEPSPSDYQLIETTTPAVTTFYDDYLDLPSLLDESQLYYKVEITDQGGNSGNSTIASTIFDSTLQPALDIITGIHSYSDVIFDRSVIVRGDAEVTFENCTWPSFHNLYVQETGDVTLDNCTFYNIANFNNPNINVDVNDTRFEELILTDCNLIIRNSKFNELELYDIKCSINETSELWSDSVGAKFSNFKAFESGGVNPRINVRKGARLNVTDINKDALKLDLVALPSEVADWGDCELYVKNSDLFYILIWHSINGKSIASFQNCSIYGTYGPDSEIGIRSNYTVFSNCTFYDLIQVDTNWQGLGSNNAFIIENSTFFNYIDVVTGGVEIDKCDFEGVMGFIWIKGQDTFALVSNSDPINIRQDANTVLTAENLVCETLWMQDISHGIFNNVDVGFMNVLDFADATIDNCHINNRNFQSPYVQITNSIVDDMAPTLATILPFSVQADFLLNWSAQSGQNITGIIGSYRIYRAYTNIGGLSPSSTDFQQIGLILNPDPSDPANTTFYDADLDLPSSFLDKKQLYYIVEITDGGGNSGNSTILSTIYDTGQVFDVLDATVLFDDSLTTYDDILVSVFMIDADINNNGTQDCGNATLQCQFKYGSTILNQIIEPTGDSIDGIVYYFLIPQTLAATEITFLIQIEQNSYYDAQGIGSFDFNSTTKYGKIFTIKRPTIAFNPVDHPTDDKILVSKRIKLSVSAISNAQYISSIKVYYRVDGGDWESKSMSFDSEDGEYSVKLPKFDACTLEYYVKYVDIAGNAGELLGSKDDPETIEIIPDFPQTKLEVFDLGMIFIGSALVGVVFGFAYIFLDLNLKKRTTLNRSQKLKTFLDKSGKSKKAPAKKTPAKKKVERK